MAEQRSNGAGTVRALGAWEFDDAIRRDGTVLAVFSADRCRHCRALEPILAEYSAEEHALPVYRVDTDKEVALAVRFEVRQIPTLILFRDGKEVDRVTGEMDRSELREFVANEPVGKA